MPCPRCDGRGHICIDDLCRAIGECMHGDSTCPTFFGDQDYDEFDGDYDDDPWVDDRLERERED